VANSSSVVLCPSCKGLRSLIPHVPRSDRPQSSVGYAWITLLVGRRCRCTRVVLAALLLFFERPLGRILARVVATFAVFTGCWCVHRDTTTAETVQLCFGPLRPSATTLAFGSLPGEPTRGSGARLIAPGATTIGLTHRLMLVTVAALVAGFLAVVVVFVCARTVVVLVFTADYYACRNMASPARLAAHARVRSHTRLRLPDRPTSPPHPHPRRPSPPSRIRFRSSSTTTTPPARTSCVTWASTPLRDATSRFMRGIPSKFDGWVPRRVGEAGAHGGAISASPVTSTRIALVTDLRGGVPPEARWPRKNRHSAQRLDKSRLGFPVECNRRRRERPNRVHMIAP